MKVFSFNELADAPLQIEAIYKGGSVGNINDDPLHILLPRTSNQGGFRITHRQDDMSLPAYVVIYTSLEELEWPDELNKETGLFRYYGDNREPGNELHSTRKKGNELLKQVFGWLNTPNELANIPPFLIFRKAGKGRDVQFLGLAVPGNKSISPQDELVAIWKTKNDQRFLNYEAYFTVIDTGAEPISKPWLEALVYDHQHSDALAPDVWKSFIKRGRNGIVPLAAAKSQEIPSKEDQLPQGKLEKRLIACIKKRYTDNPFGFEKCATEIVRMMDNHFYGFEVTRPWRDGGRDAVGKYRVGDEKKELHITCALEAKCYGDKTSVGVKPMSRLISRIKYREFGILITTSYVHTQAYKEIIEDGHPILIITGHDIARILLKNGIDDKKVGPWLDGLDD